MKIYDIKVIDINGAEQSLQKYKNHVLLIVNVASKCGFTPQYKELEILHKKYAKEGLSILGFPCNQFLSQEPENENAIQSFCSLNFGITFDMFAKIDVNGKDTHPLYNYLKQEASGFLTDSIKWNFTKFLVDTNGNVVKRYAPTINPLEIEKEIIALLTKRV